MNIELKKLNKNYQSDPNIAVPQIQLYEDSLKLSFDLNYFTYPFDEGQRGIIKFTKCGGFRIGSPNDESFFTDSNSLWNKENFPKLEWDSFYEVIGASQSHIDSFYKKSNQIENLNHYVFFMKEATFECLAESFEELI